MASFTQIKSTLPIDDDDDFSGHDNRFQSFNSSSYDGQNDDIFVSHSPPANGVNGGGLSPEENENGFIEEAEAPILPPPSEMITGESFAVREWRRQNEIRIEEKERREKEILNLRLSEARDYKVEFYNRIKITCETNRTTNREKEKVFLVNQEKFYADADKNYWKAISELIPNEAPAIVKKKGKKGEEKKPSISVVQGPKPGKPNDLTRMRQLLLKLKNNTPEHLKHSTPTPLKDSKDYCRSCISSPRSYSLKV